MQTDGVSIYRNLFCFHHKALEVPLYEMGSKKWTTVVQMPYNCFLCQISIMDQFHHQILKDRLFCHIKAERSSELLYGDGEWIENGPTCSKSDTIDLYIKLRHVFPFRSFSFVRIVIQEGVQNICPFDSNCSHQFNMPIYTYSAVFVSKI